MKSLLRRAAELTPRALLTLRGPNSGTCVALTFDDGPDPETPLLLDVLDRLRIRATFFVVGSACVARRRELLDIIGRGHEVAGHGFTHRPFPSLSAAELARELHDTSALLPPSIRQRPLVRPPRGATSMRSLLHSARLGYQTVLWSLDSDDCRCQEPESVAGRLDPSRIRPGEIVLFHEGSAWTRRALPLATERLTDAGYHFVTVGELLDC